MKTLRNLFVLLIAFGLGSCELVPIIAHLDEKITATTSNNGIYVIRQGTQASTGKILKKVSASSMRFEVIFDSTAVYKTIDPGNQGDINKLYGFSDCNTEHHNNSARFGWRWFNNRLEIHAYSYKNKVRETQYIDYVELGRPYIYEIKIEDEKYIFRLNNKEVVMPRNCNGLAEGYKLFPFFGGDEFAPHDIKIVVRDLPVNGSNY